MAILLNNDIKLDPTASTPLVEPLLDALEPGESTLLHDRALVLALRRRNLRGFQDGRRLAVGAGPGDRTVPGPRTGDRLDPA